MSFFLYENPYFKVRNEPNYINISYWKKSIEFEEYLNSSLTAIKKGVEQSGSYVNGPIEFNLAVTNSQEGGGGLKIYVANAQGKLKSEEISHIKLNVSLKREVATQFRPNLSRDRRNSSI